MKVDRLLRDFLARYEATDLQVPATIQTVVKKAGVKKVIAKFVTASDDVPF
mgnify:CR=1 FL=1